MGDSYRRRETRDRRLETEMVGRRPELGDVKQKTCDRRQKMYYRRQETGDRKMLIGKVR